MKKRVIFICCFLVLVFMLNSCVNDSSNDSFNDSLRSLLNYNKPIKFTSEGLVYKNQPYNVTTSDFEYYTFYRVKGEYVSNVFILDGTLVDFYVVDNPDFGTAIRPTMTIFDSHFETEYFFSENTIIPDAKDLQIDNIIIIDAAYSTFAYRHKESLESLISHYDSKVLQACEEEDSKESISLNQIIDFDSSIVLEKIEDTMYRECIAFAPKEYSSFYCGIYDVIEYENVLYIKVGDSKELFKIHDEYQEVLKKNMNV